MRKRRAWRAFLWCMVLGTAALIFCFSAQTGEASGGLSERLARALLRVFAPAREEALLDRAEFFVRKGAHFGEYAFLAFWICLLLRDYGVRRCGRAAWGLATLYACTDEAHQLLVSGRAGMLRDVIIDSCGALAGVGVALGILLIKKQRNR